jgi:hypothetical protein
MPLWHSNFRTNNLLLPEYVSQLIVSFWDIEEYCHSKKVDQGGGGVKKWLFY